MSGIGVLDKAEPAWMHQQITAQEYDSWSEEQCAGIEIVDGMVVVSPSASKRRNRPARIPANALDAAASPEWNADTGFDVRLQDVPLTNRRPLLVAEVVSPGSETTDRVVKVDQYAKAGIGFSRVHLRSRPRDEDLPGRRRVHRRPQGNCPPSRWRSTSARSDHARALRSCSAWSGCC